MRIREIRNSIRTYLESRGNLEESDEILINNIPIILRIIKEAETDIKRNGILFNNRKNPSLEIHSLYLNKLRETFMALGITPRERKKLEMAFLNNQKDDGFDDDDK